MTTLGALFYADVRSLVNELHAIRRAPGRSIAWVLFALLFAAGIGLRIHSASLRARYGLHSAVNVGMLDLAACTAIER